MMETIETRKRIEYRPNLKVVRKPELQPVKQIREVPDIRTQPTTTDNVRKTPVPVDHRGYIKCKKHDFF